MRSVSVRNIVLFIFGVVSILPVDTTAQVKVTASATVRIGDTLQLTAPVRGTSNDAVTWDVNGIVGGNATVGIVSASGLYIAPSTVPKPPTVRVTAVSQANQNVSSTTYITVVYCAAVSKSLVSWWPGENNAKDEYGNNRGTVMGGVTFVPGEVALGFTLDGSTGYVNVPNSGSLSSIQRTVSVEMWALPQTMTNGWAYLFSRRNPIYSESFSVYIVADGTLGVLLRTTSSPTPTGSKFESAPGAVTFGQMQHIAATADSNTSTVAAYVNGVAVPLTVVYGPSTFSGNFAPVPFLYIGRREDVGVGEGQSGAAYFPGILDEVSLYSAALSQHEIASIVAAGLNGKCR